MARSVKSRGRIMQVMSGAAALAMALAAIPLAAVDAMPAAGGAETKITHAAAPAVKAGGFALPEQHDLPGFEPVRNVAAPWPGSVVATPRAIIGR